MVQHKELNRYKMSQKWKRVREARYKANYKIAQDTLQNLPMTSRDMAKTICAILFWAEGNKNFSHIRFTNSDPIMVVTFLKYFRHAYDIDEAKLRACIHLHEYHDTIKTHAYWSEITGIPLRKFRKAYLKPHTGIRKKAHYEGCITIYYFNSSIAHELEALYNAVSSI